MGFSKYNISFLPRCLLGIVITVQCSRSFCDDEAKPKADEPVPVDAAAAAKEAAIGRIKTRKIKRMRHGITIDSGATNKSCHDAWCARESESVPPRIHWE